MPVRITAAEWSVEGGEDGVERHGWSPFVDVGPRHGGAALVARHHAPVRPQLRRPVCAAKTVASADTNASRQWFDAFSACRARSLGRDSARSNLAFLSVALAQQLARAQPPTTPETTRVALAA